MASINAKIPDSLRKRLKIEVAKRDITIETAIVEMIEMWIAAPARPPARKESPTESEASLISKLQASLQVCSAIVEQLGTPAEQKAIKQPTTTKKKKWKTLRAKKDGGRIDRVKGTMREA